MAATHGSASSERVLYVTESPLEQTFNSSYNTHSSSSEVHFHGSDVSSSTGVNMHGGYIYPAPVSKATAEVRHFDNNHNVKPTEDNQEYSIALKPIIPHTGRRIQSESAAAEIRSNTFGRDQATAQMRGGSMMTTQMEEVHTEYRDTGHATMSSNVKRRVADSGQKVFIGEGGQCTCCPYGYHVDLDFVNFCETLSDGSYLKKLKRLQKEKRKLRKSMEVFLEQESAQQIHVAPAERANFLQSVETQNASVNRVLDEIDSSVDQTLASIDTMMYKTNQRHVMSSDSEGTSSSTSPQNTAKFNTFPRNRGKNIQEEITQYNSSFEMAGRTDSQSSLSSISTIASERNAPVNSAPYGYGQKTVTTETSFERITHMTSEQLAATMATHLPITEEGAASSHSSTTVISKTSLNAVREAMAVSLQRMHDLEEQIKAIPVLQVRISVLKEEKRLLTLQQKAKEAKVNLRTIGVGDNRVDEFSPPSVSTPKKFDFEKVKTPPPVLPKPKLRSKAVGDHSVLEAYLIQPELPPSYTTRDNETIIRETYILERDRGQTAVYAPFAKPAPKPLTRTIGTGDGNVFDDSGLKIHEKELRTVIIGEKSAGKRNVGVECRVATRDVGVSFSYDDEKPAVRSIGVNVDTGSMLTSLSFKADEMRSALKEVLHRSVRSVATNCDFNRAQLVDRGVQYSEFSQRSIGCGDYDVNIELRAPVPTRAVGVEAVPYLNNKSTSTDYGWRLDAATNTAKQFHDNKACMTERQRTGSVSTMTDRDRVTADSTQTDIMTFMRMGAISNSASNTLKKSVSTCAVSTDLRDVASSDYGLEVTFRNKRVGLRVYDKCVNTDSNKPYVYNVGCNTEETRTRDVGIGNGRVDAFVCSFNDEEKMEETVEEITYSQQMEIVHNEDTRRDRREVRERHWVADGDNKSTLTKQKVEFPESSVTVTEQRSYVSGGDDGMISGSLKDGEQLSRESGGSYSVRTVSRKLIGEPDGEYASWSSSRSGDGGMFITDGKGGDKSERTVTTVIRSSSDECSGGGLSMWSSSSSSAGGGAAVSGALSKQTMALNLNTSEGGKSSSQVKSDSEEETEDICHMDIITVKSVHGKSYFEKYISGSNNETVDGKVMLASSSMSSSSQSDSSGDHKLKSCLKKGKDEQSHSKKGITFAETVVGGFTSSSGDDDTSDGEEASDSESYEEGSYDGREGSIVYHCKDDEAIARGQPGAQMFDQNIRETFELDKEMHTACSVLAKYLEDSTEVQTKELNASLNIIQKEWFRISSQKLSEEHQVEDYLSSFNEISRRLLEYIVNMQDSNGNTAIHYAVSHCNFEIVNLLLDTGKVDLDKQNKAGYTPTMLGTLAYTQTERQREVVQRLFTMGDVNAKASKNGQTALMLAVSQGRTEIVQTLLDAGASVNDKDNEGSTALMVACEHGHTEIVKLLLAQPDCDATAADNDGSTPLSIAMEAGHKDIGVLLYAHQLNSKRQPQASPGFSRSRKSSNNISPLPSPTIR